MYECAYCGNSKSKMRSYKGSREKYCNKHYQQLMKYGNITERTWHDENEIIIHEDYAEIILYNRQNVEKCRTLIDLEDIAKIKGYRWSTDKKMYVGTKVGKNRLMLHRLVMDCPKDKQVDHKSRNKLDNRKNNLRICNNQQNCRNKLLYKHNKSGHRGVSICRGKWQSNITVNKKIINLGRYEIFDDAVKAREVAELLYFGEFSPDYKGGIENGSSPCA